MITFRVSTNAGATADIFEAAVLNVKDYNKPPNVDGAPGVSLWDLVYADMLETRRVLFYSQGRSEGSVWPGYTHEERQYKRVKGAILGRKITDLDQLRWQPNVKERLFPSVTVKAHPLNIGHLPSARKARSFTFGSKAQGAKNHQEGIGRPPRWAWPWLVERADLSRFDGARVRNARVPYTTPRRQFLTIGPRTTRKLEQSAIQWAAQFTASIGVKTDAVGAMVLRT